MPISYFVDDQTKEKRNENGKKRYTREIKYVTANYKAKSRDFVVKKNGEFKSNCYGMVKNGGAQTPDKESAIAKLKRRQEVKVADEAGKQGRRVKVSARKGKYLANSKKEKSRNNEFKKKQKEEAERAQNRPEDYEARRAANEAARRALGH